MNKRTINLIVSIIVFIFYSGKLIKPNQQAISTSPTPSPTLKITVNPTPTGTTVKVIKIVDGDTIKIESGHTVRYIGIDTPETVDPRRPIQCYGNEATAMNKKLVEGQTIRLEKDISETDKYGRLLRYIWIGDIMVNEQLVREGYAHSSSYPPDIKYQDRFQEAEKMARQEKLGLWGEICYSTVTPTKSISE